MSPAQLHSPRSPEACGLELSSWSERLVLQGGAGMDPAPQPKFHVPDYHWLLPFHRFFSYTQGPATTAFDINQPVVAAKHETFRTQHTEGWVESSRIIAESWTSTSAAHRLPVRRNGEAGMSWIRIQGQDLCNKDSELCYGPSLPQLHLGFYKYTDLDI